MPALQSANVRVSLIFTIKGWGKIDLHLLTY
jgi:hypothetical protein